MSKEQAVVDQTEAESKSQAEGADSARDDLDTFLDEFQGASKEEPKSDSEQPDVTSRLENVEAAIYQEQYRRDIGGVVQAIRGELDADTFDDDLVVGYLDARAKRDPRIANAWVQRHQNPEAFNKVQKSLADEFQKRFGSQPDKAVTEDREAMAAAVRGASTATAEQEQPDLKNLSDAEFNQLKQKMGWSPF